MSPQYYGVHSNITSSLMPVIIRLNTSQKKKETCSIPFEHVALARMAADESKTLLLEFESSKTQVKLSGPPEDFITVLEDKLKRINKDLHLTINYNK